MIYKIAPSTVYSQIFSAILDAVIPILTALFAANTTTALADAYTGKPGAQGMVFFFLALTLLLGMVGMAWSTVDSYIRDLNMYKIEQAMDKQMIQHFLNIDFWRYDDKKTVDTYNLAQQFSRDFPWMFYRLSQFVSQIVVAITSILALIWVGWWLAAITVIAVVPGIVIQVKLSRIRVKHDKAMAPVRRLGWWIESFLYSLEKIVEVRLYNLTDYFIKIRARAKEKDKLTNLQFEKKFIAKRIFAELLQVVAQIAVLGWTVIQIVDHLLPIGHFIFIQQLLSRVIGAVSGVVTSLDDIDENISRQVDYQAFIEMPRAKTGHQIFSGDFKSIKLNDVSFSYPNSDVEVLKDLSLTIRAGEKIAIVGENGAGKTTMVKLLSKIYEPTKGFIAIDDHNLKDFVVDSWHKYISVLRQDYLYYYFTTVKDSVYFGDVSKPFDAKRFEEALENSESKDFVEKLPKGIDTNLSPWNSDDDVPGLNLSGGQEQRLALARNFYRNSPIIFLDEPTSSIDAVAEAKIFDYLFKQKQKTIIIISHRLSTVKKADTIYVMKDGQFVESGSYSELIAKDGEFKNMFKSQLV